MSAAPTPSFLRLSWLAAAAVTGAVFLLYVATLSRHYTGDSIGYALAIEAGNRTYLLDPYHPLLHPMGWLFVRAWQLAGWTGRALLPLQVLNALGGALAAGLVTSMAWYLSRSIVVAIAIGIGFAASGGIWLLSVEAEFVTIPLAATLLVLWGLLAVPSIQRQRAGYPVLLGLGTSAAILSYLSGAFLIPVVLVGFFLENQPARSSCRHQVGRYLLTLTAVTVPLLAVFLAVWSDSQWNRLLAALSGGSTYGDPTWFSLPHGVYAFLRGLVLFPGLSLEGTTRDFLDRTTLLGRSGFALTYLLVLAVALAPPVLAWRWRRSLWPAQRRPLGILAVWTVLYAAFGFYWVPGDVSFWVQVLAAWWLLVALLAGTRHGDSRRWALGLLAAAAMITLVNATFEVLPRHDLARNRIYAIAGQVIAETSPGDLLLARHDDLLGSYLAYFGPRQVAVVVNDGQWLEAVLAFLSQQVEVPRRVFLVDSRADRDAWWETVLDASHAWQLGGWSRHAVAWQPPGSLVVELLPGRLSP